MAWNIAVCDDEEVICEQLQEYLGRFFAANGEIMELTVFHSAEALLASAQSCDILL
ncbi:MAG: hypothetical protein IJ347_02855 [Faecalibacterium sp.]|nr:hypothetical protein [Faecalibacterium sp.]